MEAIKFKVLSRLLVFLRCSEVFSSVLRSPERLLEALRFFQTSAVF